MMHGAYNVKKVRNLRLLMMVAYKRLFKDAFKEGISHNAFGKILVCVHLFCGQFTVFKNCSPSFKSIV